MRASRPVKFSRKRSTPKPINHKHGLRSKGKAIELPANANELSPFLNLPMELKIQVASHLAVGDLLNLREISKQWAASGARKLFPKGFFLKPHRDDMTRLEAVSEHPEIVRGISHLEIYAGDMEFEQFDYAINREISSRKKAREFVSAIYAREQLTRHCNEDVLARLFPKLSALKSISISSLKFPFWDIDGPDRGLENMWSTMKEECYEFEMSHCYNSAISRRRFSGILSAVVKSKAVIDTLELNLMPIDCFLSSELGQQTHIDEVLQVFPDLHSRSYREIGNQLPGKTSIALDADFKQAVSHVTTLRMGWVGSGLAGIDVYTDLDLAKRLASFIGSFINLKSLEISYDVEEDQTDEFIEQWQTGFFNLKFSHLERLRLKQLECMETQLLPFLTRHSSTLKYLQIEEDDTGLDGNRTTKDLLTDFREKLNLERFDYLDDYEERLYDDEWEPIRPATNTKKMVTNAKLLEFYVTKKCPWPMADDEPRIRGWKRKFIGSDLEFLELTEAEMADLMGEDWETEGETSSDDEEGEDEEDSDTDFDDEMDDFDDEDEDENGNGHGHGFFMPISMLMHMGIVGDHLPPGYSWQHHSEVGGRVEEDDDDEEMPELVD